jgi:hypothetical protein
MFGRQPTLSALAAPLSIASSIRMGFNRDKLGRRVGAL